MFFKNVSFRVYESNKKELITNFNDRFLTYKEIIDFAKIMKTMYAKENMISYNNVHCIVDAVPVEGGCTMTFFCVDAGIY